MLFASIPVILAKRYLLNPEFIIAVRNDSVRLVAILVLQISVVSFIVSPHASGHMQPVN